MKEKKNRVSEVLDGKNELRAGEISERFTAGITGELEGFDPC
jgi:hypothetical protein